MTFEQWWKSMHGGLCGKEDSRRAWNAALKSVERRKTVRAKRPVQQLKRKIKLCAQKGYCAEKDTSGVCHGVTACPCQRLTSRI